MILYLFEDACFTCHCYRAPQLFCSNSLKNYFACSSLSQGMGRVETRKTYLPFQQRYLAAIKRGGFNQNLKDLIALLNFFLSTWIFSFWFWTPWLSLLSSFFSELSLGIQVILNVCLTFFFWKIELIAIIQKKKNLL